MVLSNSLEYRLSGLIVVNDIPEIDRLVDNVVPHQKDEHLFELLVLFMEVTQEYVVSTAHRYSSLTPSKSVRSSTLAISDNIRL